MDNKTKNVAAMSAQIAPLLDFLESDWPELLYTIADGQSAILHFISANPDAIEDFSPVSDMASSLSALLFYLKPIADTIRRHKLISKDNGNDQ